MRSPVRLTPILTCLLLASCDVDAPAAEQQGGHAGTSGSAAEQPRRTVGSDPGLLPLARVEGYGNPATGELWMRIAEPDAPASRDGVALQSHAIGYCEVASDTTPGSMPSEGFEFWTHPEPGMPRDAFNQSLCLGRLPAGADAGPVGAGYDDHATTFLSYGSGCALQRVGNYTSRSFSRVLLDVDIFNGDVVNHAPYGWPFTPGDGLPGAVPTPNGGRNRPFQELGLWDFGPMDPGDTADLWIYFKNGDSQDFTWTGYLLGEVSEDCLNDLDDDCDGVADNGCGEQTLGQACFTDGDCDTGFCDGAVLVSGLGAGGGALADDVAGSCSFAHCIDLIPSGDESDVDCGGSCAGCAAGQLCGSDGDCDTGLVCNGDGRCMDPLLCGDGNADPGEGCDDGPLNADASDCKSDCTFNTCGDGFLNCGSEVCETSDPNCNGSCDARLTGATFTFTGASSDSTSDCSNWSPYGLPVAGDTAIFDGAVNATLGALQLDTLQLASTYTGTVTVASAPTVTTLLIEGGTYDASGVAVHNAADLTMSGSAVFRAPMFNLWITEDVTFGSGFDAGTGRVVLAPIVSSTVDFGSNTVFNELEIHGNFAGTHTLSGNATVLGAFAFGSDIVDVDASWGGTAEFLLLGPVTAQTNGMADTLSFGPNVDFHMRGNVDLQPTDGLSVAGMFRLADVLSFESDASVTFVDRLEVDANVTLSADTVINGDLEVSFDSTLTMGDHALSVAGAGNTLFVTSTGTLVQGAGDIQAPTMNVEGTFDGGTGTVTSGTFTSSGTTTAPSQLVVSDSLTVLNGFLPNGGSVELTGATGMSFVYLDNITLNDLLLSGPTSTYLFRDGLTFYVTGAFTALGNPGNTMQLRSQSPGVQWSFQVTGTRNVDFVQVQDSNNVGSTIEVVNWTDGGNNIGWATGTPPPTHGYFVMSEDVTGGGGSLGGLVNAHSFCFNSLNNGTWLGKSEAQARGILDSAHVRAFLCDGSTCENGLPNTPYVFASVQNPGDGGASFTSDASGRGPGDSALWNDPSYFGDMGTNPLNRVWTGRNVGSTTTWSDVPATDPAMHCNGWLDNGGMGMTGRIAAFGTELRWAQGTMACGTTTSASLICFVHPNP